MVDPTPVSNVVDDPKRPWKAIVALLVAVAIAVVQAAMSLIGDGNWTTEDTLVTVLAGLGVLGVYFTTNPKVTAR